MRVGYGKIGRSMPLSLARCGTLGGDVEMIAVIKDLALRHPDDEFVLIGRNSGERPEDVGLPKNVVNPWVEWTPVLRELITQHGLRNGLTVMQHLKLRDIFDELIGDTVSSLDNLVLWVGQHGTTNTPLPRTQRTDPTTMTMTTTSALTKPHDAFGLYAGYLLRAINQLRDRDPFTYEPVFLNADARNYLKMRDMAWPLLHPVLTQRNYTHRLRHERGERYVHSDTLTIDFPDAQVITKNGHDVWQSPVRNVYSRLEINALRPGTPFGDLMSFNDDWESRRHFGLFINETRAYVTDDLRRVTALRDWVLPLNPAWVHGTWSEESQRELNVTINPVPWEDYHPRLHSVRSTFTTPSSGSGFATTKPWEAFAAGTVCFFHPLYDDQNNILRDAPSELTNWLRVTTPEQLAQRVQHLNTQAGRYDWEWLIKTQRQHFDAAITELTYMKMIEERIYG